MQLSGGSQQMAQGANEQASSIEEVSATIEEIAAKRNINLATRKETLLGTNQFPNFTEKIDAEFDGSIFEAVDLTEEGAEVETLKPYRGAQVFEALRYTTDVFSKAFFDCISQK